MRFYWGFPALMGKDAAVIQKGKWEVHPLRVDVPGLRSDAEDLTSS